MIKFSDQRTLCLAAGCAAALLGAFLSQMAGEELLHRLFGGLWIVIGVKELFFAKEKK